MPGADRIDAEGVRPGRRGSTRCGGTRYRRYRLGGDLDAELHALALGHDDARPDPGLVEDDVGDVDPAAFREPTLEEPRGREGDRGRSSHAGRNEADLRVGE